MDIVSAKANIIGICYNSPSQPNYLALFSGNEHGVDHNNCLIEESPFSTPNLGAALIKEGGYI